MTVPFHEPNELTRLEEELFRSLGEDEPPLPARRQVASALGIGVLSLTRGAAAASFTSLSGSSKVGSVLVLKWLAIGLFAGAISSAGASYALSPVPVASPHVPIARSAATSRTASVAGVRATSTTDRPLPTELRESMFARGGAAGIQGELLTQRDSPGGEHPRSEPDATAEKLTSELHDSALPSSLAAEIALLDRVRTALAARDAGAAQVLLSQFARDFPEATLKLEARVFLVEALLLQGNSARATSLGEEILRSQATGTHARRIRYLLSKSQKP